jgi:hypothetical protein
MTSKSYSRQKGIFVLLIKMRKLRFSTDAGFFSILKIIITREQLVDFWGKEINESLVCYMPKRLLFYYFIFLLNFQTFFVKKFWSQEDQKAFNYSCSERLKGKPCLHLLFMSYIFMWSYDQVMLWFLGTGKWDETHYFLM